MFFEIKSWHCLRYIMAINKAYKYEIVPSKRQLVLLYKHVGTARFVYNWGLDRSINEYKDTGKTIQGYDLINEMSKLKKTKEYKWMYEVSANTIQSSLLNLEKAYKNFFRRIKQGQKAGFPKFKKKGVSKDSFTMNCNLKIISNKKIQLPKMGKIRTKENTSKFKGKILNASVSREANRWFVSFNVKVEQKEYINNSKDIVGIDLGLTTFATLSNGSKIIAPKPLKKQLYRLARKQKQHSKKVIGSNNRKKSSLRLARLHRKIRNKRLDFIHKITTKLAKTKQVIVIEDLNVKGMVKNHKLARHISDAGWSIFRKQLEYKSNWYNSKVIVADRFYASSKICSVCGNKKDKLKLNERVYICDKCSIEIDRDINAAINLKRLYTEKPSGIYACGDESSGSLKLMNETIVNEAGIKSLKRRF